MDAADRGGAALAPEEPEAALLRGMALFGGLEMEELNELAARLQRRCYAAGELIVREGAQASELFIITSGSVEIFKERGGTRGECRIAALQSGDCFGEMALIDIMPRSASVRAREPTETLTLSYGEFHALSTARLETFTLLVMNIAREISRRLRAADSLLAEYDLMVGSEPPAA